MMFPKRSLAWCLVAWYCASMPAASLGLMISRYRDVSHIHCVERKISHRHGSSTMSTPTFGSIKLARNSPFDEGLDDDAGGASSSSSSSSSSVDQSLLDSIRSMRSRELKSELESLRVQASDVFEKEELVRRLYNARVMMQRRRTATNDDDYGTRGTNTKKKKRRRYEDDYDDVDIVTKGEEETTSPRARDGSLTITAPFIYYDLGPSKPVIAVRDGADDGTVYIRPSPGRYASIKVRLLNKKTSSSTNDDDDEMVVEWTLLVDTACSGLVLSPNAIKRANDKCPNTIQIANNAGTMTMAGSSSGGTTSVASWDERRVKMTVENVLIDGNNVAACQDIGALPVGLDGILGLSFLGRYACVDFDFANNELRLDREGRDSYISNIDDVVARGALSLTRLGVYAADVILDGRGPVKMLVDTGAASTFLNKRGVVDMRLSLSSSPQIEPIRGEQIGAMGADNLALTLTHRFRLRRRWNLVAENTSLGDFCPGIKMQDGEVKDIDIGDLPVLDVLARDGVGGILGADILMMCSVVRFCGLNTGSPTIIIMQR
jgi:hypothetical protein